MQTVLSLVSYPFLPAKVGGQKGIALFNKYFAKQVRLVCVTVRRNDPAAAEGYEVRNILSDSPLRYINPLYFFTLRKIIRETGATLLVIEHPYYGWLAALLKWFTGIRLAVHSHNIEGTRFKTLGKWWWPLLLQYERFTHRRADYNFFIHDDDKAFALRRFGLRPERCMTVTYGIEWDTPPSRQEKEAAAARLRALHSIPAGRHILFFNGAFDYKPNREALYRIMQTINPLLQRSGLDYCIIICGRDIPAELPAGGHANMIFTGFVEDISLYFKGAGVFINPIAEGGGIKTKLVEALGFNLNAVSTRNGAIGVPPALCNGKLLVSADDDWNSFAANVLASVDNHADIPPAYFEHFYWGHSIARLMRFLEGGHKKS